jgi:hypothetical protein
MKYYIVLIFFGIGLACAAQVPPKGEWLLQSMIYRGQVIPLPNPDLHLTWTFFENGTDRLYWDRGGAEFCERFAHFRIENNQLIEKTFALNPENASECMKDPDMQMDRETETLIEILNENEIRMTFPMGEEILIYVLRPVLN